MTKSILLHFTNFDHNFLYRTIPKFPDCLTAFHIGLLLLGYGCFPLFQQPLYLGKTLDPLNSQGTVAILVLSVQKILIING